MTPNSLPSERVALLGTIDPDYYTTGTFYSDWCSLVDFERAMLITEVGVIGATGTVAILLQQGTDSTGGPTPTSITGKASTGFGSTDDDTQQIINVRADELTVNSSKCYIRAAMTIAGDVYVSAQILGFDPHWGPASDNDLASVTEIVE